MNANPIWSVPGRPSKAEAKSNFRVTAADVLPPSNLQPPTAQTFEELEIPAPFRAAVENELTRDEKLLWVGRPSRNRDVHPRNPMLPWIGAGLLVLAGVILLVSLVSAVAAKPMGFGGMQVSGLFISVILGGVGGVMLLLSKVDPSKWCRFCYAVTNRRAMLVEPSGLQRGPVVQSYLPQQLLGLERRDHASVAGAGDLVLE